MKRKLLAALLSFVCSVCLAIGLSACGGGSTSTTDWENGIYTVETAYAEAQELGYSGTLEEFIASISGTDGTNGTNGKDGTNGTDGADGIGISSIIINSDGELVVTLTNSTQLNLGVITGATGVAGADGQNGEDGEDGSVWYTGSGAPSASTGKDGDMYLDTTTYDIYQMTSGSWSKIGNIKGADGEDGSTGETGATGATGETGATGADGQNGEDGEDGSVWYTGSGAPSASTGKDGDMYLDTTTYDIYQMTSGSWSKIGNIKGADGEDGSTGETGATGATGETGATGADGQDGEDGSVWYTGSGAPSASTGKDGDMYLDTTTYDIYQMTSGSWCKIGNIKGADGENGENGEDLTATTVTVSFNLNYDTQDTIESVTVTKGDSIANLPEPERDGYYFTGWYSGTGVNAGQVTDVTPISRDMTLYAQWTKIYSFNFNYYAEQIAVGYQADFHGYYETSFATSGNDVYSLQIVTSDGTTYSAQDAISAGIISDYYTYAEANGYFNGYLTFIEEDDYTVQLIYGDSISEFNVSVNIFIYNMIPASEVYTETGSVTFDFYYYGEYDIYTDYAVFTVTKKSDSSYKNALQFSLNGGSDYSLSDENEEVYIYYNGNAYLNCNITFYVADTYTITITFAEDSTSFEVTAKDWVYEGEIEADSIMAGNYGDVEYYYSGDTITSSNSMDEIVFYFSAPDESEITITVDGKQTTYYETYWYRGTLEIGIVPAYLVDGADGEYTISIMVNKEGYGSDSLTVTYVYESLSYILTVDTDFKNIYYTDEYEEKITEDTIYSDVLVNSCIYVELYAAADDKVTVTIDGEKLTAADLIYEYGDMGELSDYGINPDSSQEYDYVIVSYLGFNYIEIYTDNFTEGNTYTLVITAGEISITLYLTAVEWKTYVYDFEGNTTGEITEGEYIEFNSTYYGNEDFTTDMYATITITNEDGYTYSFSKYSGETSCGSDGTTEITLDWYGKSNTWGTILFYAAGNYTVTVSIGNYSTSFNTSFNIIVDAYVYDGAITLMSVDYSGDENTYEYCVTNFETSFEVSGTDNIIYYFTPVFDGEIAITISSNIGISLTPTDTNGFMYDYIVTTVDSDSFTTHFRVTANVIYVITISNFNNGVGNATLSISGTSFIYGNTTELSVPEYAITATDTTDSDEVISYTFAANSDAVITVEIDGTEVDLTEYSEVVTTDWALGVLTINVDPKQYTVTAGSYQLTITVTSASDETNAASSTITYVLQDAASVSE